MYLKKAIYSLLVAFTVCAVMGDSINDDYVLRHEYKAEGSDSVLIIIERSDKNGDLVFFNISLIGGNGKEMWAMGLSDGKVSREVFPGMSLMLNEIDEDKDGISDKILIEDIESYEPLYYIFIDLDGRFSVKINTPYISEPKPPAEP